LKEDISDINFNGKFFKNDNLKYIQENSDKVQYKEPIIIKKKSDILEEQNIKSINFEESPIIHQKNLNKSNKKFLNKEVLKENNFLKN